jgi:hypothetical protein
LHSAQHRVTQQRAPKLATVEGPIDRQPTKHHHRYRLRNGPTAKDFFTAFGHDGLGQIGSETTINSGDLAGF